MSDLNKKLAEWRWPDAIIEVEATSIQLSVEPYGLKLFTSSVDACFEWLVPMAIDRYGKEAVVAILAGINKTILDQLPMIAPPNGKGVPIATAFCKAIEQLIDKESNT